MKKAAFLAAWVFFALTAATAQQKDVVSGNGTLRKQKREMPSYTSLNINGPFNIRLVYEESGTITLEGDENILKLITTEVTDGTLNIGTTGNQPIKASRNNTIDIRVPYHQMSSIRINGSGNVYASRTLGDDNLNLEIEGSGSIQLSIDSQSVKAVVLGPGNITVSGNAEKFDGTVAGSGTITANGLKTKDAKAVVSGCGDIKTHCTKKITGRIDGNGTIAFQGQPSETDLKRSGNGQFSVLPD